MKVKRQVLFVTNLHFNKNGNGGQQRTYFLIKELSEHFALSVLSPYNNKEPLVQNINADFIVNTGVAHIKAFRKNKVSRLVFKILNLCLTKCSRKYSKTIHLAPSASYLLSKQLNGLKSQSRYKDLNSIVFDTLSTVVYLKDKTFDTRILNAHNFDYELVLMNYNKAKTDDKVSKPKLEAIEEHLNLLKTYEYNINTYFDEIWVCSDDDAEKFRHVNANTQVTFYTLPNGSDIEERQFQTLKNDYSKLLFVGSLNYFPNYNGLQWFVENIFMHLPNKFKLNIVGKSPNINNFRYVEANKNINLIGEVDDVKKEYGDHDILIVPLLEGSGTRLKILEAMSYGKLVVSTAKGIEGINAIHQVHYLEFNTLDEFKTLLQSLEDKAQLLKIRENGRQLIEEQYSWKGIVNNYIKEKNGK
jgi:glycosyltransferase involved in cell wall biosynthesis